MANNIIALKDFTEEQSDAAVQFEKVQARTHAFYQKIAATIPGFVHRDSQKEIIDTCARAVFDEKLLVAQAGTGIGKTLSYILGSLDSVIENNDKLIISTNTIALQTQLLEKDLPHILAHLAPRLSYQVAKGSGRYLCPVRIKQLLDSKGLKTKQKTSDLFDEGEPKALSAGQLNELTAIDKRYDSGEFDGDLDTLSEKFDSSLIPLINRDSKKCIRRQRCSQGKSCPFYIQREKVRGADIIVTNHALLSQTTLNSHNTFTVDKEGAGKPILVIDEAHKFPAVLRDASKLELSLELADKWLMSPTQLLNLNSKLSKNLGDEQGWVLEKNESYLTKIKSLSLNARDSLKMLGHYLTTNFKLLSSSNQKAKASNTWILPVDHCEASLIELIQHAQDYFEELTEAMARLVKHCDLHISNNMNLTAIHKDEVVNEFFLLLDHYSHEVKNAFNCLQIYIDFAEIDTLEGKIDSGLARWIVEDEKHHFTLNANMINIGKKFQDLFNKSFKSILLTSATMESLGTLEHFQQSLHITQNNPKNIIKSFQSPFDYSRVSLHCPLSYSEPNDDKHALVIAQQLTQIISRHRSILVLFSSKRQLKQTYQAVANELQKLIICQDEYSKSELINIHKSRIDNGNSSILFGVDGLSEGVDLPGEYLTCVIIAKLPFINLYEPMYAYESACLDAKGLSGFNLLTLPICSQKLIQSVGRLMRSETDSGEIFILDHRINAKSYGKKLLEHLPVKSFNPAGSNRSRQSKPAAHGFALKDHITSPETKSRARSENIFSVKRWGDE